MKGDISVSDKEFIIFLCEQIYDIVCDGDEPDMKIIEKELENRKLDINDIFIC